MNMERQQRRRGGQAGGGLALSPPLLLPRPSVPLLAGQREPPAEPKLAPQGPTHPGICSRGTRAAGGQQG